MGPNGRVQPYIIQMQERLLVICGSRPVPDTIKTKSIAILWDNFHCTAFVEDFFSVKGTWHYSKLSKRKGLLVKYTSNDQFDG